MTESGFDMLRLEMALHPDDAPRLSRLKAIAARRAARGRPKPLRLVWHDTPDAALEREGLALLEQKRAMRLERLRPNGELWLPGAPAPVVAEPASPDALPSPLMAWAAMDGSTTTVSLNGETGPVALSLLQGTLRSVTAERPACRIEIAGPAAEVLPLASTLAAELRASVPPSALSAEALAFARAAPVPARRLGVPELRPGMSIGQALSEITAHLTDVLLHHASRVSLEAPEPVHQARVAMRRLRSALAIFRRAADGPAMGAASTGLKALGKMLGPARDWDVFVRGLGAEVGAAMQDDRALQRLLRAAQEQRRAAYAALTAYLQSPDYRRLGIDCVALASGAGLVEPAAALSDPLEPFASEALARRHTKLLSVSEAVEAMPAAALHEIRLQAKRLRYAAEFFAPLWPGKAAKRYVKRLAALQESLGVLNDAAVASALLASLPRAGAGSAGAAGVVRGFAAARLPRQRPKILKAWGKFAQAPAFWSG